jgi:hypothetical protein
MAAVAADIDLSDRPDAGTIELRLRSAFHARGEPVPPILPGISRLVAAGTGARGTRSARLLWLGTHTAAGAVRWAWRPGPDAGTEDRRSLRGLCAGSAALAGIAVLLTTAAVRTTGWRRLPWAGTALLAWLSTGRAVALGALMTTVIRAKDLAPPPPESWTT